MYVTAYLKVPDEGSWVAMYRVTADGQKKCVGYVDDVLAGRTEDTEPGRVFGLPCPELGPGLHDFVAVADLRARGRLDPITTEKLSRAKGLAEAIVRATPYPPSVDGVRDVAAEIAELVGAALGVIGGLEGAEVR